MAVEAGEKKLQQQQAKMQEEQELHGQKQGQLPEEISGHGKGQGKGHSKHPETQNKDEPMKPKLVHEPGPGKQEGDQKKLPEKMKAARVVEFGKPIEIQEVDVKKPGPLEVLVQITMVGVCHTDVDVRSGELPALKPDNLPHTLGHEGVGKVYATGPGVTHFKVGDRVCCNVLTNACLCCENCLSGWETACTETKIGSCHDEGQFSQFFLAKEAFLCKIPDQVSDEEAAPINCAGVTSYKALKVSGLRCGQWVVIIGAAGGLGYYAIQFAKAMGLKVIAVARGEDKMHFLEQFEGIQVMNEEHLNITEEVNQLTNNQGAHGVLVIAPSIDALEEAPEFLKRRGKLIVVGQPKGKATFDPTKLIMKSITMIGTMVGTRCDLKEALQFVADGLVKSEPTVRDFNEIDDILNELSEGKVHGRIVVKISEPEQ